MSIYKIFNIDNICDELSKLAKNKTDCFAVKGEDDSFCVFRDNDRFKIYEWNMNSLTHNLRFHQVIEFFEELN